MTQRKALGSDVVFRAPNDNWTPISPKYATAQRISTAIGFGLAAAVAVALSFIPDLPRIVPGILLGVIAAAWVWSFWFIGRRVRSYGYAERDDDLLVTSGIMFRRLVVVPYGRMQLVDVVAGPIDRMLGVASVQLHTAAAASDAKIPGLLPEDAAGLRDRLALRGEERTAGL